MRSELTRLLRAARARWEVNGYIPLDVAVRLMGLGIIVSTLEAQWSKA